MPVYLSDSADKLSSSIADHLNHLHLADITQRTNPATVFVQGKLIKRGPYVEERRYVKAVISEDDVSISVFFHDYMANVCMNIPIGTLLPAEDSVSEDTRAAKAKAFTVIKLADLKDNTRVNVWGVVETVYITPESRGRRFILTLVEPSAHEHNAKLRCCLLIKKKEHQPELRPGDILRISGLKIQAFGEVLHGMSYPGMTILVYDSKGVSLKPRSQSPSGEVSPAPVLTDADKQKLTELRSWRFPTPPIPNQSTVTAISGMKPTGFYDIVCQVVGKAVVPEERVVLLQIWDATKPVIDLHKETDAERLQLLQVDQSLASMAGGCLVHLWLYDNHWQKAAQLKLGSFIKVVNVHVYRVKRICRLELTLHGGTSFGKDIISLSEQNPAVVRLKAELQKHQISGLLPSSEIYQTELGSDFIEFETPQPRVEE